MFNYDQFTKQQLVKDAIKELLTAVREGNNIRFVDDGFIVLLYPQRNPSYQIRLSLAGKMPCVTRVHKYKEHTSKEVL